jgi:lipid-A-disaccharide synthase
MKRILMVAGEASGDLHGARLADEIFRRDRGIEIFGIGGPAMRKAGVKLIDDVGRLGVVGIVEVVAHFRAILTAWRRAKARLSEGIDLLVLVDYPDFNLRLAKVAKARSIPVVYYISPQIWAWRSGRLATIAKRVDRMLVILPFEEAIYRDAGIDCTFVGHPLLDQISPSRSTEERKSYLKGLGLDPERPTIGLLPGSRRGEVVRHLPVMIEGMRLLEERKGHFQILLPMAPTLQRSEFIPFLPKDAPAVTMVEGEADRVIAASDAVVVASGTATLQAALLSTPMVILYKVSPLTIRIGRWLVRSEHIGLVNIIAGKRLVPELIQEEATGARICEEVSKILEGEGERIRKGLEEVSVRLGAPGASGRAAERILELVS